MMKHAVILLLSSSLLLLPACREEKSDEPLLVPQQESATDSATHPASPGGTALVPDVSAGATVVVMLTEGSIAVREQTIPPGPAVLTVENRGKEVHNLYVEGEGINRAAGDSIAAGSSSTVDVNFKPGTYTLYCPILNHREQGEQVQITIGGASGTAPAATATTATSATTGT